MSLRLPAEWEPQDALLTTWPHDRSIWEPEADYDTVCETFVEIARETSQSGQLCLLIVQPDTEDDVLGRLIEGGCNRECIGLLPIATNDCWTRDFGPITVYHNDEPVLLDFTFNGWGLKYPAELDNKVTQAWSNSQFAPGARIDSKALVLEGGSIESDGQGRLLTTAKCLLETKRNPTFPRDELDWRLQHALGVNEIIWLENGWLAGDDTDAHVDNLARFAPDNVILHVTCNDPDDPHYKPLAAMACELRKTGADCRPIPLPAPIADKSGRRLPASYLNFVILNHLILVPSFDQPQADDAALQIIAAAFPDHQVIPIDSRAILQQNGGLHCVSMHLPEGVLVGAV